MTMATTTMVVMKIPEEVAVIDQGTARSAKGCKL
jgi:hypothetical protein